MLLDELSRLDRELTAARENCRKAEADAIRIEIEATLRGLPPGRSDTTWGLAQAKQSLKKAAERYRAALKAYSEYGKKR